MVRKVRLWLVGLLVSLAECRCLVLVLEQRLQFQIVVLQLLNLLDQVGVVATTLCVFVAHIQIAVLANKR